MRVQDLTAFLERGWKAAEASKADHWAREFAVRGSAVTVEASRMLWEHMRAVRPDWPSQTDREADLAHHIELKRAIDRAAGAFTVPAR